MHLNNVSMLMLVCMCFNGKLHFLIAVGDLMNFIDAYIEKSV